MIRLAGASIDKFDSGEFSHSVGGTSFVLYTFNHNRGRGPDNVKLTLDQGNPEPTISIWRDTSNASTITGFDMYTVQNPNTAGFRVFNQFNTGPIRVEMFWY